MSGSDDNTISSTGVPPGENDDLTADYRAKVQEYRKKRRDGRMTARPPGKATKTLGRPAIFGDTSEIARPKQSAATAPSEPAGLTAEAPPNFSERISQSQSHHTPASAEQHVSAPAETLETDDISVEDEISRHLRTLYNARKLGSEIGTGSAFAQMHDAAEQRTAVNTHGIATKRRSSLTGSLAHKTLPTAAKQIQTIESSAASVIAPVAKPTTKEAQLDEYEDAVPSSAAFGLSAQALSAPLDMEAPAQAQQVNTTDDSPETVVAASVSEPVTETQFEDFEESVPSSAAFGLSAQIIPAAQQEMDIPAQTHPISSTSDAPPSSAIGDAARSADVSRPPAPIAEPIAVVPHLEENQDAVAEVANVREPQASPPVDTSARTERAVVRKPRYHTDLRLAGTEKGIKTFTDRYGRRIEAFYSTVLGLPDQFYLVSQDGQFAQGFQLCENEEYWGARHDDNGKVVARMVLNPDTGTVVGQNLITRSLIRLDPSGDRVEQIRTPAGMKVTIHFASEKTAKKITGNHNLAVRYCEYTAAGWLIRRDDYLRTGVVESSFFDANMRVPSPERRLRALTRVTDRQGVKEKSHEEFTYHPERHEAVRIRGSYTDAAGRVTDMHFVPGDNSPVKIKITDPAGFTSQLARNPSTHSWEGTCCDRNGTVVENIVFDGRALTYRNYNTGKLSRTETFDLLSNDSKNELQARHSPASWNSLRGRSETVLSNGVRILKYPTGRTDKIDKDGSLTREGHAGERSFAAPSGEALVTNPDGSAIRIHRNYTAELKEGISGTFIKGSLSEAQRDFLEKNRSKLDLRDFARFSQQWHKQPEKLEATLRQLEYLVAARYRDVPLEQVEEIRNCVLHHIAYPEEIFQGHAPTSGAAVVQRLLAADLPARYASIVKESLTRRLTIVGSDVLAMDVPNMLRDDMSARDIASRLFQSLVMRAALHPRHTYTNSWTGTGADSDVADAMPAGLTADMITAVIYKITGVETAVVEISSIEDLRHAYNLNGKRTMIVAVDGNDPPLGCAGSFERQLVTVTGFIDGRIPRIMVANQLGAQLNHCERRSALDARVVFESMNRCARSANERFATAIIFGGHHATRYKIEASKLIPIAQAVKR